MTNNPDHFQTLTGRWLCRVGLAAVLLCGAHTAIARDIELQTDASGVQPSGLAKIKVGFGDPNGVCLPGQKPWVKGDILPANAPVVTKEEAWIVEAKKGDDIQKPKFKIERTPRHGPTVYQLSFFLDKTYEEGRTYTVKLAPGYDMQLREPLLTRIY